LKVLQGRPSFKKLSWKEQPSS